MHLIYVLLMSNHIICFYWEIRNISVLYTQRLYSWKITLSGAVSLWFILETSPATTGPCREPTLPDFVEKMSIDEQTFNISCEPGYEFPMGYDEMTEYTCNLDSLQWEPSVEKIPSCYGKNCLFSYAGLALNTFPASGDFCCLLITFANSLDQDQAWSGSKLFDTLMVFPKDFFEKVNFKKIHRRQKMRAKILSMQRVKGMVHFVVFLNFYANKATMWVGVYLKMIEIAPTESKTMTLTVLAGL